jgi:hypothetical protein
MVRAGEDIVVVTETLGQRASRPPAATACPPSKTGPAPSAASPSTSSPAPRLLTFSWQTITDIPWQNH